MRAITPDLEAILVSRFQAGASGFRGRLEIDRPFVDSGSPVTSSARMLRHSGDNPIYDWKVGYPTAHRVTWAANGDFPPGGWHGGPLTGLLEYMSWDAATASPGSPSGGPYTGGGSGDNTNMGIGIRCRGAGLVDVAYGYTFEEVNSPGATVEIRKNNVVVATGLSGFIGLTQVGVVSVSGLAVVDGDVLECWVYSSGGAFSLASIGTDDVYFTVDGELTATESGITTVSIQPTRISIDKSRKMAAQQLSFEVTNEDGSRSRFPSQDTFVEDMVVRAFEWYGDPANEVQVFTGLTDKLIEHRDPRKVTVTCRSMLKRGIVQTFSTIGPQGADEAGAIRTAENGVYLGLEASEIVSDIADRMGWPTASRAISVTSFMVDEYVIPDGTSWAEAISGTDRLTAMTGYELFDDEDGVLHFEPAGKSSATDTDTAQVPDYTFTAGVDITSLDLQGDDYDLKTRVKVTGPLTTNKPAWVETWHTNVIRRPVGLFYDPADATHLYVLDRSTSKLYKLLQSDRSIVSSVAFSGISYPLGISGDPSDATIVWILNAPWRYTGSTSGNSIKKVRRSDGATLATYALANGRWTTIKVSASYIWLGNWDTDKVHKHSKADGSSIASYTVTYASVAQTNPTGLAIDGTTILAFFYNMSGGNRFLLVDESDPTTVDPTNALGVTSGVVSTAGTTILGGEMDTTTHEDLYACSDDLGLVWKFHLVSPVTNNVATVAADQELEDLLGLRSQAEPRIHDLHPGDPEHPYEIRRMTLALKLITSLAQATEAAIRQLAQVSRFTQTLDAGIIGNPALQLRDMVAVVDPVSDLESTRYWLLDTYRTELDASAGTFVGTVALLPWSADY